MAAPTSHPQRFRRPLEKEFTLDWAKRLAPLLEQEGWQVFLTRTSDVTVSNLDRVVSPRHITRSVHQPAFQFHT